MARKRPGGLEQVADALRKGKLSDGEYERVLDEMLGPGLEPRDRAAEARWERQRRRKDVAKDS